MKYPHLAARLFNTPLLVHPQKLDAIIAGLGAVVFYLALDYTGKVLLGYLGGYAIPKPVGDGGQSGSTPGAVAVRVDELGAKGPSKRPSAQLRANRSCPTL